MANNVDLNGSSYIQDIPGIYFDASASLIGKLGDEKAGNYITKIGLATGGVVDLTINLAQDPDNPGKVIASTIVANTTYYISGLVADALVETAIGTTMAALGIATAPVWLTVVGVGAAIAATTYWGGDLKNWVYHDLKNSFSDFEEYGFYSPEIVGTVTKDKFIAQSAENDPNFCKNIFPDYVNYRQITEIKSGSESFLYNQLTKDATVNSSDEKTATEVILKNTNATKLTLNNQTYNIASDNNNLLVRNALDSIPAVSVLLSHIDIYAGEKIDLGNKGVYTVKGGDTFSQIANTNGFNTKELLKRNTWLIDEGKVHFDQDKVLVDI